MMNKKEKSPLGRPREFDDTQVLQRAAQAFLQDGFEAASYERIAKAMGLSKPSLYNAFGNKSDLFERVIADYAQQAHEQIISSFSGADSLEQGIQQLFQAAAHFYSRPDDPSIGCLLIGTALPATTQYEGVRTKLSQFIETLECSLEETLASQYQQDAAQLGKSSKEIAMHISSLVFALAVRARMGLSRKQLSNVAKKLAALLY